MTKTGPSKQRSEKIIWTIFGLSEPLVDLLVDLQR